MVKEENLSLASLDDLFAFKLNFVVFKVFAG